MTVIIMKPFNSFSCEIEAEKLYTESMCCHWPNWQNPAQSSTVVKTFNLYKKLHGRLGLVRLFQFRLGLVRLFQFRLGLDRLFQFR